MVKFRKNLALFFFTTILLNTFWTSEIFALTAAERKFYAENYIMFYNPDKTNNLLETGNENLCLIDLGDSAATILNFLIGKNYSINSAAGIVGNLMAESGLKPNLLEGGTAVGSDYILYDLSNNTSNYLTKSKCNNC